MSLTKVWLIRLNGQDLPDWRPTILSNVLFANEENDKRVDNAMAYNTDFDSLLLSENAFIRCVYSPESNHSFCSRLELMMYFCLDATLVSQFRVMTERLGNEKKPYTLN
ncbi:hypothetical protein TNIN_207351 [Trichonephila inaurata madagascariensis]|uniref:Uncharacterized protein n=1 Tax=Trichonephila inaurata madagascariensis TaxID=2747483 RepID=A0A8X7C345_9ARAC|nr:hypothetical protein TNIN_207351 [Trichonephila inaurata madagascariensis]